MTVATDTPTDRRPAPPLRAVLLRGVPLTLLTAVACAVAAYLLSSRQDDRYEASALVLVRPVGGDPVLNVDANGSLDEGEGVATDALLLTSRDILAAAIRREGLDTTPEELEDAVSAEAISGTNLVRVTASAGDAQGAAARATGVAETFVRIRQARASRRARRARTTLLQQYDQLSPASQQTQAGVQLLERIRELRTVEGLGQQAPQVAETARVPEEVVSPKPRRDAVFGGLFGLVLGAGLAVLWVGSSRRPGATG
jgi:uncharacterized protein involved in exopolysaccharide biosynthesis